MKKFNLMMLISFVIYITCAMGVGYYITQNEQKSTYAYRIDVNRIINELQDEKDLKDIDLTSYKNITKVTFLDQSDAQVSNITTFYEDKNEPYIITPWIKDNQIKGYLRFDYHINQGQTHLLSIMETILIIVEGCVLILLWYIRKHLIKPFDQLSELPESFAKGHYKENIKVEKSRYLQRFLWGMSQMQDTLDITKKRQIELLREKKQMHLSLSHDIKTPLNLIKLYSKALKEHVYDTNQQQSQIYDKINDKCEEIERYVNEIMKTSREDILDLQVEKGEFYLYDLIQRILHTYQEQCAYRQIELRVGPCENRLLYGDIDRSQEVLENLFENAFKYGDGRWIEISFYEEDGCQLIRVYNSGDIIEERELVHLFESFYRGSNAQHQNGNGLGLYIARTIMRKMEGEIFVQQEKDGMSFTLVFH